MLEKYGRLSLTSVENSGRYFCLHHTLNGSCVSRQQYFCRQGITEGVRFWTRVEIKGDIVREKFSSLQALFITEAASGTDLNTPYILGSAEVATGSLLTLQCLVSSPESGNLSLQWIYPGPKDKVRITQRTFSSGLHLNQLTVRETTSKDNGTYFCIATADNIIKAACHHVIVRGGHVRVTPRETRVRAYLGEKTVSWKVKVDAEPEPKIILKRDEMELPQGMKFEVEKNLAKKCVIIRINDITREDLGNYTLVAQVGGKKGEAHFQLGLKRP
ncbi:unnamed protein product [Darwinula stevensoni]|uniref:Ig-like domain-containing protein n=1 Tax=Darwinula stevensoni TaxID=69355 RepID=A0A7R9A841_9CRUS|nr:unnamed protein product [Darwinula stevensoni]CAG0895159.1 unnamed protein product [Darwinula stevensoni]